MKKLLALCLAVLMALCLVGCSSKPADEPAGDDTPVAEAKKVALLCSTSGLGDNSFNDGAWAGFQKAAAELGVEVQASEPGDAANYLDSITALCDAGFELIFATGSDVGDALSQAAELYPEVHFVGLNVGVTGDNVTVARTGDHQLGFLAGALAAMVSESGVVGYLGGKENATQLRFMNGFVAGAEFVNPDVTALTTFVGAFNDPATGKEYSIEQINQGADVIYHTAGGSGNGLFEAIQEYDNVYAIGVDSNQDGKVEGKVLTTTLKNLDVIAFDMIKALVEGTLTAGEVPYDLTNGGVGLTDFQFTKEVIGEENLAAIADIMAKIASGEIEVYDSLKG